MDLIVEAVYESGVLKLSEPLPLVDGAVVTVLVKTAAAMLDHGVLYDGVRASDQAADPLSSTTHCFGSSSHRWTSKKMHRVVDAVRKVALTELPVLLLGENGTEKEAAALAVHSQSSRKDRRFVTCTCGLSSPTLGEVELFGEERNTNHGKRLQKAGAIEAADGGTLFLDDIGKLPDSLQFRLVRFLKDRTIQRAGGVSEVAANVRIVAASDEELAELVSHGSFLGDLYYKLSAVMIRLPPFRECENYLACSAGLPSRVRRRGWQKASQTQPTGCSGHTAVCVAGKRERTRKPNQGRGNHG